eukprot:CAMPEP_0175548992 /NCGR_PEP_ID=MMETSP0096-20121207/31086_1 /TAXON_ID=311494 /ORGANISM="Alexandrium monilatum, Strain CCMP3105" /LENGTH=149 /DNA_ID=CAMNT_0016852009 /DNA_START=71 /DNA_END=517 /DNA_ORIENTATION=+
MVFISSLRASPVPPSTAIPPGSASETLEATMVFNMLFGSRILPRAMPRSAASAGTALGGILRPTVGAGLPAARGLSSLRPSPLVRGLSVPFRSAAALPTGLVPTCRAYGTRSLWNVKSGKMWLFVWIVPATIAAFVMQELAGPYIFFHE